MADETTIHVDSSHKRQDLPEYQQNMPCPHCGKPTETGFGMAGGGMGIYSYCEPCGKIVSKSETE